MTRIQRYIFLAVLRAVLTIVGGLTLLALLAQGLSQTDLIVDNRQSALTYLKVVALSAPQIIALLAPIAVFVATLNALNRIHRDSEIVVSYAAGMTRWQIVSPILRLAGLIAIAHLCVNLFVQPLAQRELRETISDARADLAASLVRPGAFTNPSDGLTLYAREFSNGIMRGMLVSDMRSPENPVDYIAQTGEIVNVEGSPAIRMIDGQIQQVDVQGQLSVLDFDEYVFELIDFLGTDSDLVLKASDRFLFELFSPDLGDYNQFRDRFRYLSEAHSRLSGPLMNLTLAMLAALAVLGGQYSRRGYQRRISLSVGGALLLMILVLVVQPQTADAPELNWVQYAIPLGAFFTLLLVFLKPGQRSRPLIADAKMAEAS